MPKDDPSKPFQGYSSPNYTPVPDQLFDEQLPDLTGAELKALLYIMRRTFGFKKESDNISLSQICTGITTREGRVLDRGTGLSKDTAVRALRGLEEKNVIRRIRRRSEEKGDEPTSYSLNTIPVSDFRTPPGVEIGHPLPRKSDTQETVIQKTVKQETDPSNLIRKVSTPEFSGDGGPHPHRNTPDQTTSQQSTVSAYQPTTASVEAIGTTLQRRRGRPSTAEREVRQVIEQYMKDFAREFNDQAPLKSSTTRAINLMQEAGISLEQFVSALYEARAITKHRTGSIRAVAGQSESDWTLKQKMPYFFSVLEDVLGLKEEPAQENTRASSN